MCRTVDTEVTIIYAWKWSFFFFCLVFVVGIVLGCTEAELSLGFVVVTRILSLPRASNSCSVYLVPRRQLVYQRLFLKVRSTLSFPLYLHLRERLFPHSCLSPSGESAVVTQCLPTWYWGLGDRCFCCPGSASAIGSCWVGVLLVFLTQFSLRGGDGQVLEHFRLFPCLTCFSDLFSQSGFGFCSVG